MPVCVSWPDGDFVAAAGRRQTLRQTEIGDVRLSAPIEENVGRLQIAMQDAALVSVVDGPPHLDHQRRQGRAAQRRPIGEAAAVDQLHAEIRLLVVLADIVNGDNVGMVEQGGRLGFQTEAGHVFGQGQTAGADHLEGDDSVERAMPGFVNHPHAAAGDLFDHFVLADFAARSQRGRRVDGDRSVIRAGRRRSVHGDGGDQIGELVLIGEEGAQLASQMRTAGQPVGAVGGLAGFDGLQVGQDNLVQFLGPSSGLGPIRRHESVPLVQVIA